VLLALTFALLPSVADARTRAKGGQPRGARGSSRRRKLPFKKFVLKGEPGDFAGLDEIYRPDGDPLAATPQVHVHAKVWGGKSGKKKAATGGAQGTPVKTKATKAPKADGSGGQKGKGKKTGAPTGVRPTDDVTGPQGESYAPAVSPADGTGEGPLGEDDSSDDVDVDGSIIYSNAPIAGDPLASASPVGGSAMSPVPTTAPAPTSPPAPTITPYDGTGSGSGDTAPTTTPGMDGGPSDSTTPGVDGNPSDGAPTTPTISPGVDGNPSDTSPTTTPGTDGNPSDTTPTTTPGMDGDPSDTAPTTTPGTDGFSPTATPGGDGMGPPTVPDDDAESEAQRCLDVANGEGPTADDEQTTVLVDLELQIADLFEYDNVADAVRSILQARVAPGLAGCEPEPEQDGPIRRRLQDGEISNVLFYTPTEDTSEARCDAPDETTCYPSDMKVDVWHDEETDKEGIKPLLIQALEDAKARDLFAGMAGMGLTGLGVGDVSIVEEEEEEGASGVAAIKTADEDDKGLRAGGYVGIAVAAVALILLLLFLVGYNRRSSERELKHMELDDSDYESDLDKGEGEKDGDTLRLSEEEGDSLTGTYSYKPRMTHVVGEEDSIVSGWTGYSAGSPPPKDPRELENHGDLTCMELGHKRRSDVHACTSATCEACEQKRQQGPMFILSMDDNASYTAGISPAESNRQYVATDTVDL